MGIAVEVEPTVSVAQTGAAMAVEAGHPAEASEAHEKIDSSFRSIQTSISIVWDKTKTPWPR